MKTINLEQKEKQNNSAQSISLKVYIRVRKLIQSQTNTKNVIKINPDNKTLKVYHDQINYIQSKFDHVFIPQKNQKDVFSLISQPIKKIFSGYNLTVFAYGQTGSGKTYTMFGKDWENLVDKHIQAKKQNTYFQNLDDDTDFAGIIPRAIHTVFTEAENKNQKFQLFCSFLQIYNQKIFDLLQDSPHPKTLSIHESKSNGIFVQGLTQFQVQQYTDCLKLMKKGQKNRFIRQTSMNAKSSRSHTIFQILVESIQSNSQGNYIKSRLNLCDLAGSQKINKKQVMVNDHLEELKNINLSLTTLGKVIKSLSSDKKANVAAFRQSKLTRLLQESLTTNTNTFIIGALSPSSKNIDQTLNTLKFAERASHITMKVKPIEFNQINSESTSQLKRQIQYLKQLLDLKKSGYSEQMLFNLLESKGQQLRRLKQAQVSQKDFQRILQENIRMKKQIYSLQIDLEKVRSENHSSFTSRSKGSSHFQSSDNYPSRDQLRREVYLQKFLKKKDQILQKSNEKLQSRQRSSNSSMFVAAGKATIDTGDFKLNGQDHKNWLNKKEKQNILNRMEKLQTKKKLQDSLIIDELENLQNYSIKKSSPFMKSSSKDINNNQLPKRYHQANVFRRGKMVSLSLERPEKNQHSSVILQEYQPQKKKKIDYGNKIKQLEAKLYGFK